MDTAAALRDLRGGAYDRAFAYLYGEDAVKDQAARYEGAVRKFEERFGAGREIAFFSAPGRTEVGGNHTDHQHGRVLAGGVNLDVIAVGSPNGENVIRIKSEGFHMDVVDLADLAVHQNERNHASSLIRGIAARFGELGHAAGGFDAYTTSNVLRGSGLSSSAAFEVLVGTILSHLYNGGGVGPVEVAQIGQYAENFYFGKPCGLMDQTASSVGGFVAIDFADPAHPDVEKIGFDFARSGYALCIVDTGGNHADLTGNYADVPDDMRRAAALCGGRVLREIDPAVFYEKIPEIRKEAGDRAVLRAIHFFGDNERVKAEADALRAGDFEAFKRLILESGASSFQYLQNVYPPQNPEEQGLSVALALSERLLAGRGAWRVHGGGFAGTIQAFVPTDLLERYRAEMEAVFGEGKCYVLGIRPVGGVRLVPSGLPIPCEG